MVVILAIAKIIKKLDANFRDTVSEIDITPVQFLKPATVLVQLLLRYLLYA